MKEATNVLSATVLVARLPLQQNLASVQMHGDIIDEASQQHSV